jgi:hypothetical protein
MCFRLDRSVIPSTSQLTEQRLTRKTQSEKRKAKTKRRQNANKPPNNVI